MTAHELALLRDRVARARLELPAIRGPVDARRQVWRDDKRRWRNMRSRYCLYCGEFIRDKRGRFEKGLTCAAHRDLPACDPMFRTRSNGSVVERLVRA